MTAGVSIREGVGRMDREVAYTTADFQRIAQFLHATTGIRLTEGNERMVYARLASRVLELGLASFSAYVDLATSPREAVENDRLISALTTNTTHFYRESYHFDFLAETILPDLIRRAREGDRVRIWSAGCSTGDEPYSIALCLLTAFPDVASHDVRILATDIDRTALARAETANYSPNSLRDLPKALMEKHFDKVPDTTHRTPKPGLRALIAFRQLNLVGDWPFKGPFDVIFCRNVAIYMDADTQEHVWTGFRQVLRPGGHLFIGHSERLSASLKSDFSLVGTTTYRRSAAPGGER
ncbi:MAG: protein-glutamate O-methyltransferase CheR [Acetobacteraceae bacterium]|nr:MAG: protein-glutamate O-methyltransferase CheR [Acetobacteraceae bacterium]